MKKLLLLCTVLLSAAVCSQQSRLLKLKKYKINTLDGSIRETSGLSLMNGKLYTFNDSGNTPELFELDKKTGTIMNTITVNGKNKDWEALANDGTHFYIGDFGNNAGTRRDLEIYKVPAGNGNLKKDSVTLISFEYPEQNEFRNTYLKTDFDAEAMIWLNGKLHLFTKEWGAKSTTHYLIDPEAAEKQQAEKAETFPIGFMVTDAAYTDGKLYLVGYTKKTEVFLCIFNETEPGMFFKESPARYYLGSALSIGQIEGIAADESGIWVSGENFNFPLGSAKQALYFVPVQKLKD